jgi:hypothetical protein
MEEIIKIIIPLLVGSLSILVALKLIEKKRKVITNGIETEGTIVGFEMSSIDDVSVYYPIIRFITKEGSWITVMADYAPPRFLLKEGQKVKVMYNTANPKEFVFNTAFNLTKLSHVILVAGLICLATALWFTYKYISE